MKPNTITKKIINSFLVFSIITFIGSIILHGYINSATAVGSSGGRITAVVSASPSCPEPPQIAPCTCGTFHTTIQPAPGSVDVIFCFPFVNLPIAGIPITLQSVGYLLLGNFTLVSPIMESINWGTSYTPG